MDQNCLGYVTQRTGYEKLRTIGERIFPNPEFSLASQIPEAQPLVVKKLNELGFDCRLINNIQEVNVDENGIAFWGFFPNPGEMGGVDLDFHFAQFKNGVWSHKPDWKEPPCEVSFSTLCEEYGSPTFFAIRERTP